MNKYYGGLMLEEREPALAMSIFAGIAAGIAGFLAFKRSGKTLGEFSGDIASGLKENAGAAGERIKDGIADARAKAAELRKPRKDGVEEAPQASIAEEALSLKQTGKKPDRPVDPTIEQELKTGAISY